MSTETTTVQAGAALRGEPAAPGALAADLRDARARTQAYVADLSDARLMPPLLECINPLLWELGHVAYFAEFWTLRHLTGRAPLLADADQLYDSAKIAHDERWHLPLPSRQQTAAFMERQLAGTLALLDVEPARSDGGTYFHRLALFHEDMHGEALLYTRQTLAYERPALTYAPKPGGGALPGDVAIPGGSYTIGTPQDERHFVFDNEKWAHEVELAPFAIARAPVTCAEFRGFVEDRGYLGRRFWSDEGWAWREAAQAEHPLQWQRTQSNGWERRHFARFVPLADNEPIAGVNAFEAEAYCAWAGRRLPSEAEWEVAATGGERRRYPWGDELGTWPANLDARFGDVVEVGAFGKGESPFGVRGMLGNVWEWTATPFEPYPGFAPDPYAEYSAPWFGTHRVLRGGAWTTRARLISTRWRNYYRPHRCDIVTGFRTCSR